MRSSTAATVSRVAPLIGALVLQACSFAATRGPSTAVDTSSPTPPECTTDRLPPTVDAVIAGIAVGAVVGLVLTPSRSDVTGATGGDVAATIGAGVIGATFGTSSVIGFLRTARCSEARLRWSAAQPKVVPQPEVQRQEARAQPLEIASLRLVNGAKDVQVNVTVFIPETQEELFLVRGQALTTGATKELPGVLRGREAQRMTITATIYSEGEWHPTPPLTTYFQANDTFTLYVDWNPERSRFDAHGAWSKDGAAAP